MASSIRHYLFPENAEPVRLSQRLVSGLVLGKDAMPQFTNSRQKVLSVSLLNDDGKPAEIERTHGSIWEFDEEGEILKGLREAVAEAMNSVGGFAQDTSTVVSISPRLSKKRLADRFRWEPSRTDIERIIRDIWPKNKGDRLQDAKGSSSRPPPLTYDAQHALEKASGGFWGVASELDSLKEPSLKALAFQARKRAKEELEYRHLYTALALMADDRLELKRRHKSGKGTWYAVLEVFLARPEGYSETVRVIRERCDGRSAAVIAVRRLLVENAGLFSADTTLEPSVITDLEWEAMMVPDE